MARAAAALVAALALLSFSAPAAAALSDAAEISPSVLLIGEFDWRLQRTAKGEIWSRCLDMVWRAAERAESTEINFVPTHHWIPPDDVNTNLVAQYCTMSGTQGDNRCKAWSDNLVEAFRDGMTVCFAEALRLGLTIGVRPHLDDGTGKGAWRNALLLEPARKYGGASYYQIMLAPLADAMSGALNLTQASRGDGALPTIYFALQGEMSATVMRFPRQWAALIAPLRKLIGPLAVVKFGVGLNWNRLDDTSSTSQTYSSSRLSWLAWSLGATDFGATSAPPLDVAGVKALMERQLDFIGISAYAPLTGPGFALNELENAAFTLGDEMQGLGIDIRGAIDSGKLELHYSEYGLGGGARYSGNVIATSPYDIALKPFFGIYGPYRRAADPWAYPDNRAFLREFYSKTVAWVGRPKTYRVSKVFIWCLASWDVLGVYPESTTPEGSYHDPVVSSMVRAHNAQVRHRR